MLDIFNYFISNAYANSGITFGQPRVVSSMVSTKGTSYGVDELGRFQLLGNIDELRIILKDFPLTRLMLGIISSTINDIIARSDFNISIENDTLAKRPKGKIADDIKKIEKLVNKFLNEIDIKSCILNNLEDALYEGSYAIYIKKFVDKKTRKSTYQTRELMEPNKILAVNYRGKLKKYVQESSIELSDTNKAGESKQKFDPENILWLCYNPKVIKRVKLEDSTKDDNSALLVDLEFRSGEGILDSILPLLYEYMLKYWMKLLLSLKDTLRPDILVARMNDKGADIARATDIIQNIEAAVNNNENAIDLSLLSPYAVFPMIRKSVLNSTKVVPGIQNFTDFELLQYPDIKDKIEKLNTDLENLKAQIGNQIGIPQELIEGNSNRWEVISRSSRFLTVINEKVNGISKCIRTKAAEKATELDPSRTYSSEDIKLTLDTTNIIFNTELNSRVDSVANKMSSISRLISDFNSIQQDDLIGDKQKALNWFKSQLEVIDPSLAEALTDKPPTGDEGGGFGGGGFGGGGGRRVQW